MVMGAFLLPNVFTGVAESAGSELVATWGLAAGFGLAVVEATGVVCEKAIGMHSAAAPKIANSETALQVFSLRPPVNFEEFNSASLSIFKDAPLYLYFLLLAHVTWSGVSRILHLTTITLGEAKTSNGKRAILDC
jgi:hypothetical protein